VGAITFGVTVLAAIACASARETYRIHMKDLGDPNAVPVPQTDYERIRAESVAQGQLAKA